MIYWEARGVFTLPLSGSQSIGILTWRVVDTRFKMAPMTKKMYVAIRGSREICYGSTFGWSVEGKTAAFLGRQFIGVWKSFN